ncbi:MAG TPA: radical SAM family heme chaperone HemW [Acidobacteriota bacterium]|nr:radical SAM family heme chaperone HemW [Acidobacteriota bacterium]
MNLGFGLYVHIPFCVRKCPYCDFVSAPVGRDDRVAYLQALESEIRHSEWKGQTARTIYLGGGTPSELEPDDLGRLVDTIRDTFRLVPDAECSIECNPGTLSPSKLEAMRSMGFNRLSLGAQSFSDRLLGVLGRIHTGDAVRESYSLVRAAGFDNLNLDLIFGIPGQTLEDWQNDLHEALQLRPEHLSLYGLTIEPDTEFGKLKEQGRLREADEEVAASMCEVAVEMTADAGYEQYEISNFALPGKECRHNLIYWRNEEYLGFGVSAASYVGGARRCNTKDRRAYVEALSQGRLPSREEERLDARSALGEEIMLRLRLADGFSSSHLRDKYGLDPDVIYADPLSFLVSEGLLARQNGVVRLTPRGRLLANEVCRQFL